MSVIASLYHIKKMNFVSPSTCAAVSVEYLAFEQVAFERRVNRQVVQESKDIDSPNDKCGFEQADILCIFCGNEQNIRLQPDYLINFCLPVCRA